MKAIHDLEGQKVDQFLIKKKLASTNFSFVYLAEDTSVGNSPVAIKFAQPDANLPRFVRDAVFLRELSLNSHVVQVYNVIPASPEFLDKADYVYFVMQYVPNNLARELESGNPLPADRSGEILKGICNALHYAHTHHRSIIHNDIKPANILLGPGNHVYLCDFGLARSQISASTIAYEIAGTWAYMSPEQLRGEELDHRSDIYSLGVVLFEMLSGRLPFSRKSPEAIATAILKDAPPRLDQINKEIPREIAEVVGRCLKKDKSERFNDVMELQEAFHTAMLQSGLERAVEPNLLRRLMVRILLGSRRTRVIAYAVSLAALLFVIADFILLRPAEIRIEPKSAQDIGIIVDNLIWKNKIPLPSAGETVRVPHVLIGKRGFTISATDHETKTFMATIAPFRRNDLLFKIQPLLYHIEITTIPRESFVLNSFQSSESSADSLDVDYSDGDTLRCRLKPGTYTFDLRHADYQGAHIELQVGVDAIRWRRSAPDETYGWRNAALPGRMNIELEPQLAYITAEVFHRRIVNGRAIDRRIRDLDDCAVRITKDSGLSPQEEQRLARFLDHASLSSEIAVPAAVKSLTFGKPNMEDFIKETSLTANRSDVISVYLETEKQYGRVRFITGFPCGVRDGTRMSVTSAQPASEGTYRPPLSNGAPTPRDTIKFETGRYTAAFSALGWFCAKEFTIRPNRTETVECRLNPRTAMVRIFLGGMSYKVNFRRLDSFCPESPFTVVLPIAKARSMQIGAYELEFLDPHSPGTSKSTIAIERDTTIQLSPPSH